MISTEEILVKSIFTIKDLAQVTSKQTQTIRKWEREGIISKCSKYSDNGWRQYNRKEFADILEQILDYKWERQIIKNPGEIQYIINELRKTN